MKYLFLLAVILSFQFSVNGQNQEDEPLRIIVIGAHPDDADIRAGGTAALFADMGHKVKFLALTNGDAGHTSMGGGVLAKRRREEAKRSAEILGIEEYEVLDNHDGELIPSLHVRHQVIRRIRDWNADIVITHRPNDYHPDHRNTGIVVQDAAYLVIVPNITPDTPPLEKNPLFLYLEDNFQKPNSFSKDIAVVIDEVIDTKVRAMAAHESQMFEWLPWTRGVKKSEIPEERDERLAWLKKNEIERRFPTEKTFDREGIKAIQKWYPSTDPETVKYVEFFEISEFGKQPTEEEVLKLFPMLNKKE
jgi:LmbE family N-acetylglucosaminyl deacetylase